MSEDKTNKNMDEKKPSNNTYKLDNEEILKLKNLSLQKQLVDKEMENILLQQQLVIGQISGRVGEDVSKWHFDLQQQAVMKPPEQQKR